MARGYLKYQFSRRKPNKRITGMYNADYPIFKDFLHELFTKIKENKINRLIIDLRYNSGGDFELCRQLLYYLSTRNELKDFKEYVYTSAIYKAYFPKEYEAFEQKYVQENHQKPPRNRLLLNQKNAFFNTITNPQSPYFIEASRPAFKGKVYILANQNTGSAAALLTAIIQDNGIASVIGTSVGNNPTGATTFTPFKLPKTKASVSIACTYSERPDVQRDKVLFPDVWMEPTFIEWLNGKLL
jgi:C-terminal processing protease CtpA/Prc